VRGLHDLKSSRLKGHPGKPALRRVIALFPAGSNFRRPSGACAQKMLKSAHPMKRLWTPWRKTYIENHSKDDGCVFCNAQSATDSPDNLIVYRGERAFVILNRFT
jgi:hypothetical protein